MSLSTSLRMKIYYDNASGVPVEITLKLMSDFAYKRVGENQNTRPYGVGMDQFTATGIGHIEPITIGGLLQTVGVTELDHLFADRIPEDPDTATRTFTVDWDGFGRTTSVETRLTSYDTKATKTTGLTMVEVVLQPTGEVIETFAT